MDALITTEERKRSYSVVAVWCLANVVLIWLLAEGQVSFAIDRIWIVVLILLPCVVVLMYLLRNPIADEPAGRKTDKSKLFGLIVIVVLALLFLQAIADKSILFLLPIVAAVILFWLKPRLERSEWTYATFSALVAGVTGLSAGWISYNSPLPCSCSITRE